MIDSDVFFLQDFQNFKPHRRKKDKEQKDAKRFVRVDDHVTGPKVFPTSKAHDMTQVPQV